MLFYIDECLSPRTVIALKTIFVDDRFTTWQDENLGGTKDIPLFAEMKKRAIEVFVTVDKGQL
jgi:hypothetical protein